MTRIGFAYNLKPASSEPPSDDTREGEAARPDEEPPSTRRDGRSRNPASPARAGATVASASPATDSHPSDEFAEWDSQETIDAVARALSAVGDVVHLEANADFPERLRAAKPDIVFNIAEGLHGVNREAHVPAICEFFGVPYSGSDPFTLSLCLDKARTKEVLSFHGVPTASFALIRSEAELDAVLARTKQKARSRFRFPLFAKPVHEGSSKGITERNYCRTAAELRET